MGRVACALLLLLATMAAAAEPVWPRLSGRVVDGAGVLSQAARDSLTEKLAARERATGDQMVVATVPSLQGLSVEEFRQALSGIRIVAWHEQGDYLAENGYLLPALQAADRALRALGLLKGPAADASAYQITPWRISTPP